MREKRSSNSAGSELAKASIVWLEFNMSSRFHTLWLSIVGVIICGALITSSKAKANTPTRIWVGSNSIKVSGAELQSRANASRVGDSPKTRRKLYSHNSKQTAKRQLKQIFQRARWRVDGPGRWTLIPQHPKYLDHTLTLSVRPTRTGYQIQGHLSRPLSFLRVELSGTLTRRQRGGMLARLRFFSNQIGGASSGPNVVGLHQQLSGQIEQKLVAGLRDRSGRSVFAFRTFAPQVQSAHSGNEFGGPPTLPGITNPELDRMQAELLSDINQMVRRDASNRVQELLRNGWWEFSPDGTFRYTPHDHLYKSNGHLWSAIDVVQGRFHQQGNALHFQGNCYKNLGGGAMTELRLAGQVFRDPQGRPLMQIFAGLMVRHSSVDSTAHPEKIRATQALQVHSEFQRRR